MWFECVEIFTPATLKNHEKSISWVCDHIQRKKETHRWIQTLWNLSLLGFSICLQALKNSKRFGNVFKKWWDRITYWKWEDCDLTKKHEYPSMEHILLLMDFKRICLIWERHFQDRSQDNGGFLSLRGNFAGFWEDANWWKVIGQALRLLGKDSGTVGKQLDGPRISPRCLEMISRISPHGHPNLN